MNVFECNKTIIKQVELSKIFEGGVRWVRLMQGSRLGPGQYFEHTSILSGWSTSLDGQFHHVQLLVPTLIQNQRLFQLMYLMIGAQNSCPRLSLTRGTSGRSGSRTVNSFHVWLSNEFRQSQKLNVTKILFFLSLDWRKCGVPVWKNILDSYLALTTELKLS